MEDIKEQLELQGVDLLTNQEFNDYVEDLDINKEILSKIRGKKYGIVSTLKNNNTKLKELNQKKDDLKERISNINEKNCPICFQYVTKPMFTPCCKNVFCFECLMTSMNYKPNCPFCRTKIHFNDCCLINNSNEGGESKDVSDDILLPKIKKLMKLLKEKKNKRILLFSGFDNTFLQLEKEFNKNYGLRGVWKLLSQLRDMGVVKEVGERNCRITKRNVIEWDFTDNLPKNIKLSKNSKQDRKESTLNCLRELYKKVNAKSFDEDWVKLADLIKKI